MHPIARKVIIVFVAVLIFTGVMVFSYLIWG